MAKKALTPTYFFFYLLFWPDTWRILIGLVIGWLATPWLSKSDDSLLNTIVLFVMPAAIGYAASARPAQMISVKLRRLILKNR